MSAAAISACRPSRTSASSARASSSTRRANHYRISHILTGENDEDRYRSPLTEVGVDVHEGDYVHRDQRPAARRARQSVPSAAHRAGPARAAHRELASWRPKARARCWSSRSTARSRWSTSPGSRRTANTSRRRSNGEIGYLHIPDMGGDGIREFIKWYYPQLRKQGLVVDVRDNGGGNVSAMIIERLSRKLLGSRLRPRLRNHRHVSAADIPRPSRRALQRHHGIGRRHLLVHVQAGEARPADRHAHMGRRRRHQQLGSRDRRRRDLRAAVRDREHRRPVRDRRPWRRSRHRRRAGRLGAARRQGSAARQARSRNCRRRSRRRRSSCRRRRRCRSRRRPTCVRRAAASGKFSLQARLQTADLLQSFKGERGTRSRPTAASVRKNADRVAALSGRLDVAQASSACRSEDRAGASGSRAAAT